MRSHKTRFTRLTTHVTLFPQSTSPVGAVFEVGIGDSTGRLLDAVDEPRLAVLATATRQNRRSEQETGDEGEIEEHSERKGMAICRWSKERHETEAETDSAVRRQAFIRLAGRHTAGNVRKSTHAARADETSEREVSQGTVCSPQLTSQQR